MLDSHAEAIVRLASVAKSADEVEEYWRSLESTVVELMEPAELDVLIDDLMGNAAEVRRYLDKVESNIAHIHRKHRELSRDA